MRMGSVVWYLVGESGREGGEELYKALSSAVAGSMLGHEGRSDGDDDDWSCR
jgi:hypothetical protein